MGALAVEPARASPSLKTIAYAVNHRREGVAICAGELSLAKKYSLVRAIFVGFRYGASDNGSGNAHGAIARGHARVEIMADRCCDLPLRNEFFRELQISCQKHDVSDDRIFFVILADGAEGQSAHAQLPMDISRTQLPTVLSVSNYNLLKC